jgi:hypothetical protein
MKMNTKETITANPIDQLLSRLDNVKGRAGTWRAKCPVHQAEDSKSRTLSIKETETGSVLMYCHAGCPVDAILNQISLTLGDLFPPERYTQFAKYISKPLGKAKEYVQAETMFNVYILDIAIGLLRKGLQLTDEELDGCVGAILRLKELHHE